MKFLARYSWGEEFVHLIGWMTLLSGVLVAFGIVWWFAVGGGINCGT
jgi:hypothetical protein